MQAKGNWYHMYLVSFVWKIDTMHVCLCVGVSLFKDYVSWRLQVVTPGQCLFHKHWLKLTRLQGSGFLWFSVLIPSVAT